MKKQAIAKAAFRRSDTGAHVRRGEKITGDAKYIDELAKVGVVYDTKDQGGSPESKSNPSKADGAARKSSASPAARASRQTTAKPSADGAKAEKGGE